MTSRIQKPMLLASLAGALLLSGGLSAQIQVPGDEPTISDALNVASPGDVIQVAAGTYNETITVSTRVTIMGAGSGPAGTIITGMVTIDASGLSALDPVSLESLRISGSGSDGARFINSQSFIRFQDVAFVGNSSDGIDFNVGIGVPVTDIEVQDCLFQDNGNGIRTSSTAQVEDVTIADSDFVDNQKTGILLSGGSSSGMSITRNWTVTTSLFAGNEPTDSSPWGGGMWLRTSGSGSDIDGFTVSGTVFRDNGSGNIWNRFGASVFARDNTTVSNVSFTGCLFEETTAPGTQTIGIAVDVGDTGTLVNPVAVTNCTFHSLRIGMNAALPTFTLSGTDFVNVTSPVLPRVGDGPFDVTTLDHDGDGSQDIATADNAADTVTILLNDGAGVFNAAAITVPLTSGDMPRALTTAQSSGGPQLVVACGGSGMLRVVDGTSVVASFPITGTGPSDVESITINGSPDDDVLVITEGDIFGGATVETFSSGTPTLLYSGDPNNGTPKDATVGDLDGDGDDDLAVAMSGGLFNPGANEVLLWEGDGTGSFSSAGSFSTSMPPTALDAFDMDGDGLMDLVVAEGQVGSSVTTGLVVYENTGSFAFSSNPLATGGTGPSAVVGLDLGDDSIEGFESHADVVSANADQTISGYEDWGGGAFAGVTTEPVFATPTSVDTADFNTDGVPDLVVTTLGSNGALVILGDAGALAQPYGTGCLGTGGLTPQLQGLGDPVLDGGPYTVELTNALAWASGLFAVSTGLDETPLGSCTILIQLPALTLPVFTDNLGEAQLVFQLPPPGVVFTGLDVYLQAAVFDPAAADGLALSNGLRLKLGF